MTIKSGQGLFKVQYCDMTLMEYALVFAYTHYEAVKNLRQSGKGKRIFSIFIPKLNACGLIEDWVEIDDLKGK